MEVVVVSPATVALKMVSSVALIAVMAFLVHLYKSTLGKSYRIRKELRMQGIKGPPPSFLYGNLPQMQRIQSNATSSAIYNNNHHHHHATATAAASASASASAAAVPDQYNHHYMVTHDYTSTLFPYFEHWRKEYGSIYTYSTGMRQHLYVNKAEVVKEMMQSTSLDLGKPTYVTKRLAPMLGNGILRSNGHVWSQQRKIIAPHFYMDKVKGMVGLMVESAQPLLRKWEECIESQGGVAADVSVDDDLRGVSAEVISRACFGSSYAQGKLIFSKLRFLQKAISTRSFLFGATTNILGFFRKKQQKEIENMEREIESLIWEAVMERRKESVSSEKDLSQLILEGALKEEQASVGKTKNNDKDSYSKSFIVDNCKNIYFAGHEATAVAASWCLMMLALHPEWQLRMRTELDQVCQKDENFPTANSLLQLKTVTMVIQETLRLYPPAAFVSREALEETQLGSLFVPKGVYLWTLIPTLHLDPEIWGPDANVFKPERFAGGVSQACKLPQAYIPFGVGPRLCLGKNFAMAQLKIVLSLIVSKFSFSLSPKYRHSPAYRMIVEPGYGVDIRIQKI